MLWTEFGRGSGGIGGGQVKDNDPGAVGRQHSRSCKAQAVNSGTTRDNCDSFFQ
jgi:hypothetical protein